MFKKTLLSTGSIALLTLCAGFVAANAEDWPVWRGPNHNGISKETGWSTAWGAGGPKELWKASVGTGFSAFSVSKDRVYTMGNANDTDTVFCFDANTGAVVWKHSYPSKLDPNNFEGGPTATPTIDGDAVYTFGRYGQLFALDAATGKVRWEKNVLQETGAARPQWGISGSVLIEGNLAIVNAGNAGVALNKADGKLVWKTENSAGGYSTPVPIDYNGKRAIVCFSAKSVIASAVADGKKLWEFPWVTSYDVNAADPVIVGDKVFVSSGYGRGCGLFQIKNGEATKLWENKNMRNHFANCVLVGNNLYGFDGQTGGGDLKCLDFETGAVKWSQPGYTTGGLMVVDGKLVLLADKGKLVVADASPAGFKELASAQPLQGKCWTMPVLANGHIYCRNAKGDVVCLDVKK